MKRVHRFALATLLLTGASLLASALYVPVKAMVGQQMLDDAWESQREGASGVEARPWGWADIHPIAKLSAPRLGVAQVVLNNATGEAMAWGPGHVAGTQPFGAPGLSAAAAHRDTHFAFLADVAPGDELRLELPDGRVLRYRAVSGHVVDSRTWRFPAIAEGPDVLALSTCWPFDAVGEGPERFVLTAERIDAERGDAEAAAPEDEAPEDEATRSAHAL